MNGETSRPKYRTDTPTKQMVPEEYQSEGERGATLRTT